MIRPQNAHTVKTADDEAVVSFSLPDDFIYFKGHFRVQPLLPAFVQLSWAVDYGTELFGKSFTSNFPVIKFLSPILPLMQIELKLKINEEKKILCFEYVQKDTKKSCSAGKVKFL